LQSLLLNLGYKHKSGHSSSGTNEMTHGEIALQGRFLYTYVATYCTTNQEIYCTRVGILSELKKTKIAQLDKGPVIRYKEEGYRRIYAPNGSGD